MDEKIEEQEESRKVQVMKGIDHLITTIEDMPSNARVTPLTQYDQLAMLLLMKEILVLVKEE